IKKLEISTNSSLHHQAAHYYCEMASKALKDRAYERARYCVKQALTIDRKSVRASLMLADMEIKSKRTKQAIKILKRVPHQDPEFITEIIKPLMQCYKEINAMPECVIYLQ